MFISAIAIQEAAPQCAGMDSVRERLQVELISLNVARPRLALYKGATVNTGIFKKPVSGRIALRTLNLEGDQQADLSVHGGPYKAIYAYPAEHYEYWRRELPDVDLPWGMFGENFTTEGVAEDEVHVGDRFRIGSAMVMVRQPRMPCYKLTVKFQRDDILQWFLLSGRSGVYFSVEQEGEVGVGDSIELASLNPSGITIGEMNRLFVREKYNHDLLQKAIATDALPETWREYFVPRLKGPGSNG
ncbi:MAG: MOSC domain-containing protein [Candidatus Sulfotelmatobacter sp.]